MTIGCPRLMLDRRDGEVDVSYKKRQNNDDDETIRLLRLIYDEEPALREALENNRYVVCLERVSHLAEKSEPPDMIQSLPIALPIELILEGEDVS